MPTKELAIISARPDSSPIKELVGQHLVRLAELIRKDGAPYPLTPQLVGVWVDVFQGASITTEQAEAAFHKAERACKFWPSPADVLGSITTAKNNAAAEAAEEVWEMVLDIRRKHWCPDAPGGFYGGKPQLSPRVEQACRASGVFRDHDSLEALHVWAKKKFIESFIRWDETEESQNLLPDGEIKNLLAGAAQAKALPAPVVNFHDLHERGLRYAEQNKLLDTFSRASRDLSSWEPEKLAEVEAELRNYGERFKAAMEKRQAVEA